MTITKRSTFHPWVGNIDTIFVTNDGAQWFPEQFANANSYTIVNYPTSRATSGEETNVENRIRIEPAATKTAEDPSMLLTIQRDLRNLRLAILDDCARRELLERTDTLIDNIENTLAEM